MKKQLIFGSLLAFTVATNAQVWTTSYGPGQETTPGLVGIGTNIPAFQLDVNTSAPNDGIRVFQTNGASSGAAHLYLDNNDGHNWSLLSTGGANSVGRDNFVIYDWTRSAPRLLIDGRNGYAGIGGTSPQNRLEITHGTNGQSGLRFTNLTAAATPGSNPGPGVLSVDANGDVVYVSGTTQAQNGLNTSVASPNVELGGNLIRHTNVAMYNSGTSTPYNICFNGKGIFGVSNTLNASGLGSGFSSKSLFHYDASGITSPLPSAMGCYYRSTTTIPFNVTGFTNIVDADVSVGNLRGQYVSVIGDASFYGLDVQGRSRSGSIGYGIGINAYAAGGLINWGGIFHAVSPPGPGTGGYAYGVMGEAKGEDQNMGGFFRADSGAVNIGVEAETRNMNGIPQSHNISVRGTADCSGYRYPSPPDVNIGILGQADYARTSIGVCGFLSSNIYVPTVAWGVRAAIFGSAAFATTGFGTNYAGYFAGDVLVSGVGTIPGGVWTGSDKNFKKNITPITDSKKILQKLQPKSFYYDQENEYDLNFTDRKDYGIIAQELEEVLPELVRTVTKPARKDSTGKIISKENTYKVVNYNAFIGILIANAKEQQETIDAQQQVNENIKQQLEEQKKLIDQLTQSLSKSTGINSQNTVEIGFQLSQNEPNPFTHETIVKYTLPQTVGNAYMAVYDLTGKQMMTFQIRERNSSSITITSENLPAGIYIYSIVADGKIVDSKRMVVADK